MKDWKAIANATGSGLSGKELTRVTQLLETLEQSFRPLAKDLSPDVEPCVEFHPEAGVE